MRRDTPVFLVLKVRKASGGLLANVDNLANQDLWESLVSKVKLDPLEVQVRRAVVVREVPRADPLAWF